MHLLIRLTQHGSFWYDEPSRIATVTLLQAPTLAALRLGLGDLDTLATIFSVTLNVLPVLAIGLCFHVLPPDRRAFFLLPAFAAFGGIYSAWYGAIAEGLLATAYFWLLFYLILFGPDGPRWRLPVLALALPTFALHEPMVFLAPLLALAALTRSPRAFFLPLALWFAIVAIHAGFEVAHPHNVRNRDQLFDSLLNFHWIYDPVGNLNAPAILMLCAAAAILGAMRWPTRSAPLVIAFAAAASLLAGGAFLTDRLIAPGAQFNARYLAQLLSFPLGLAALASLRRPVWVQRWATPPTLAIVLILGLAGAAWNVAATRDWVRFTDAFRAELAANTGLVPWDTALHQLAPDDARRFARLNFSWTSPELSIVLSPGGRVRTIIADPISKSWRPFDPAVPAGLPSSPLYSTADYQAALQHSN